MRHPQRALKPSEQLFRYRPSLDTLEDRTIPGNTFVGPTGLEMPISLTSQKLATNTAAKQAVTAKKAAVKSTATPSRSLGRLPCRSFSLPLHAAPNLCTPPAPAPAMPSRPSAPTRAL